MDVITYALAKKMGGGGGSITYTLTADTENKTIVLTPSEGTAQVITVPYATDASTVNGHEVPELENGKIPANFLPSFVDNVDEYDTISLFPVVGESNRIYIDKSTNKTYRWSGTAYVEISESIALGETSSTAYRGDRGKIAYDHSQSAHAPSNAEANQNAFSNVKIDSDTINAGTTTDTLEFIAGDNIILTPNVSNKKITVSQVPVRATASGNIASFSDGTGDPFLEVKVNIEPQQDLHGYDNPWPAGGGVNLFPALGNGILSGVTYTTADDGTITLNGTCSAAANISLTKRLAAGRYSICDFASGTFPNNDYSRSQASAAGFYLATYNNSASDFVGQYTLSNDSNVEFRVRLEGGFTYQNCKLKPMIVSGEKTTMTYSPYSNICPISGWSAVDVTRCGKNFFDINSGTSFLYDDVAIQNNKIVISSIGSGSTSRAYFAKTYKPGTYTFSAKMGGQLNSIRFFSPQPFAGGTYNSYYGGYFVDLINGQIIVTMTEPFTIGVIGTGYKGEQGEIYDIQLELGSTATSYTPYQGSTASIPFHDSSDNPITVYGGTLNVTSGELKVDRVSKTYVGASNENWIAILQGFYIEELTMQSGAYRNGLSNWLKTAHNNDDENSMSITFGTQYQVIKTNHIKDNISDITDVASWKTYLASNNLTVNYPLATPQTYQLTPTQVSTLLGQNNIFADCGQIEVAYKTPFYTDLTTKNEVQVLINESITSALNASY